MSRVSIGLPYYNNAGTLVQAVKSVFSQTIVDWELILVDDGSDDGSYEQICGLQDDRVRYYRDGLRLGLAARLNQIAQLANFPVLARMDADDIMHPERLERQLDRLTASDAPDLVGSNMWVIDEDSHPTGRRMVRKVNPEPGDILKGLSLCHPTIIGHTDWFRRNPYDPTFRRTEDVELWSRTFSHTRYTPLDSLLMFYRESPGFKLEKYRIGLRERRAIIRRYGPQTLGRMDLSRLLAKSILKEAIAVGSSWCGLDDAIVSRRNRLLTDAERREAEAILQVVTATNLPFEN